ncbi:HNH endonuclease signature motif containing protein [Streptomyces sp. NPDC006265]|uniref:HNH endonuclease n=1 Tax=Streptomyces sp. NPDC006265 TaxID=3156740 RepID=UPI0033B6F6BF
MDTQPIENFYRTLDRALGNRWSESDLKEVAELSAPSGLLGRNEWILRADYSITVGRWFIEGLVDLGRYARNTENIGYLFREISQRLQEMDPQAPKDELQQIARQLTSFAWRDVKARREAGRERIDNALRSVVWFRDEPLQRCYLCGYKFCPQARDLFLRRTSDPVEPHKLVDFTRPRGVRSRHLRVELDHVVPVAEGGTADEDNLRLACGWCNNVKSNLWSVYDAKAWSIGVIEHPSLGVISVPQPFWTLRVVATRARCEAPQGCGARLIDHELFAAPRNIKGALTPTNLMVVCREHDPWAGHRLVSPRLLPGRKNK